MNHTNIDEAHIYVRRYLMLKVQNKDIYGSKVGMSTLMISNDKINRSLFCFPAIML